jgi:hypothetical protein
MKTVSSFDKALNKVRVPMDYKLMFTKTQFVRPFNRLTHPHRIWMINIWMKKYL